MAGIPSYPRNFSRDVFTAGILAQDEDLLSSQIVLSSYLQGRKYNKINGQEPGKIHHEYPGVSIPGSNSLYATYDACDSTSLYLIAFEALQELNQPLASELITVHQSNIEAAVGYILHHVQDDLFHEFPPPGAARFALKATYWKDSEGPLNTANAPIEYPIAYALAHFQAARGLMAAAKIQKNRQWDETAQAMFKAGIAKFITPADFVIGCGPAVCLSQDSSDELHSLAYIPAEFASALPLKRIAQRATILETPAGFACMPQAVADRLTDTYHGYVVWPFEQAIIHYGASKFGLKPQVNIAKRVAPLIGSGQELFDIKPHVEPRGNARQLWSEAAAIFFSRNQQPDWL